MNVCSEHNTTQHNTDNRTLILQGQSWKVMFPRHLPRAITVLGASLALAHFLLTTLDEIGTVNLYFTDMESLST